MMGNSDERFVVKNGNDVGKKISLALDSILGKASHAMMFKCIILTNCCLECFREDNREPTCREIIIL